MNNQLVSVRSATCILAWKEPDFHFLIFPISYERDGFPNIQLHPICSMSKINSSISYYQTIVSSAALSTLGEL